MRIYVMVGAPGAGKGTQAVILSGRLGLPHVASGDLLRANVDAGTPLGREAQRYMDRGSLVPDSITIGLIEQRLSEPDARDGAVLDGFPRTRRQAEVLDEMLGRRGGRVAAALFVDVDRDTLIERLAGRWVCRATSEHLYHVTNNPPRVPGVCDLDGSPLYQRDDDRPETVRSRLERQLPPMYEVVDYYTDTGVLTLVNGEQAIDDVTEDLVRAIAQPAR